MSNSKNFISMMNMIDKISEQTENKCSFNNYMNMVESVEEVEHSVEESETNEELESRREEYVKELKDKEEYFKKRYGEDWESVMYGTATNLAKKDLGMD